jgi:Signal transduction histidine kinase
VTDDGGGSVARRDLSRSAAGSGHGLVGMRERIQVYDGRLQAGPVSGGGFRVEATLPLALGSS